MLLLIRNITDMPTHGAIITMNNYGIAIERWDIQYTNTVLQWLEENFGIIDDRWGIEQDYDLFTLWMDEDVYMLFLLRWS
jgi:hypothetical protein